MTQIASVDYSTLRITLHVDTVTQGFSPALMQQEYRSLRRTVDANRQYDPMVSFQGLQAKGGGNFTTGQTLLRASVRIIPHDTDQQLDILDEILNVPDGLADRNVFDRTGTASNVDIDPTYSPVEIREVNTGSAVTPQDILDIKDAIFDEIMEGSLDFRDFQLIQGAALGGKASGMETTNGIFRGPADTKNRISVTMDEFGNRTAIVFDLT
jgi:hypothetical protein